MSSIRVSRETLEELKKTLPKAITYEEFIRKALEAYKQGKFKL